MADTGADRQNGRSLRPQIKKTGEKMVYTSVVDLQLSAKWPRGSC